MRKNIFILAIVIVILMLFSMSVVEASSERNITHLQIRKQNEKMSYYTEDDLSRMSKGLLVLFLAPLSFFILCWMFR